MTYGITYEDRAYGITYGITYKHSPYVITQEDRPYGITYVKIYEHNPICGLGIVDNLQGKAYLVLKVHILQEKSLWV